MSARYASAPLSMPVAIEDDTAELTAAGPWNHLSRLVDQFGSFGLSARRGDDPAGSARDLTE